MQTSPLPALAALLAAGLALPAICGSGQAPHADLAPLLQRELPLARSVTVPGFACDDVHVPDWWKLVRTETFGPALGGPGLVLRWPLLPTQELAGEFLVGPSSPGSLGLLLVGERGSSTQPVPRGPSGLLLGNVSQVVLIRFDTTGYASVPVSFASLPCLMGTGYHFSVQALLPTRAGPVLSQGLEVTIL